MPLFHVAGSVYGLCGLYVGARNVVLREVVPQQILEVIDRYRVSKTCLVPAVILMLLDGPSIHVADLSSLQLMFYGASPIPIELLRNALAVFKCDFVQLYGLTETGGGSPISVQRSMPISLPSDCYPVADRWTVSRSASWMRRATRCRRGRLARSSAARLRR